MLAIFTVLIAAVTFSDSTHAGSQLAQLCDTETARLKERYQTDRLDCKRKFNDWDRCVRQRGVYNCFEFSREIDNCWRSADKSRRTWYIARRSCFSNGRKAQRKIIKTISKKTLDPTSNNILSMALKYRYIDQSIKSIGNTRRNFEKRIGGVRVLTLSAGEHLSSLAGRPSFAWLLSGKLTSESTHHLVGIASYADFEFQSAIASFDQWHFKAKYERSNDNRQQRNTAARRRAPQTPAPANTSNSSGWRDFLTSATTAVSTFGALQQLQRQQRARRTPTYSSQSRTTSPTQTRRPSSRNSGWSDAVPGGPTLR